MKSNIMTPKQKETIRGRMHELLDIILDTNGFESRKRSETGTLPTVFLNYSGHVGLISIDLHTDGWQSGEGADKHFDCYIDRISPEFIELVREGCKEALTDKKATDVLRRDIARQEGKLKDAKNDLARMKRTLLRKEKEEKRYAELDVLFDPGKAARDE